MKTFESWKNQFQRRCSEFNVCCWEIIKKRENDRRLYHQKYQNHGTYASGIRFECDSLTRVIL